MNMNENQVLEWGLLMGNDYTDTVFDNVEFYDVPRLMIRRNRRPHEVGYVEG